MRERSASASEKSRKSRKIAKIAIKKRTIAKKRKNREIANGTRLLAHRSRIAKNTGVQAPKSRKKQVRVWAVEARTKELGGAWEDLGTLEGHGGALHTVAWSADARSVGLRAEI